MAISADFLQNPSVKTLIQSKKNEMRSLKPLFTALQPTLPRLIVIFIN